MRIKFQQAGGRLTVQGGVSARATVRPESLIIDGSNSEEQLCKYNRQSGRLTVQLGVSARATVSPESLIMKDTIQRMD